MSRPRFRSRALGLLSDLAEYALEIGAGFLSPNLAGHVDEALRLRGIVGGRLGLAWHDRSIHRSGLLVEW